MDQKTFEFKLTALDTDGRTIEGYAAVFGNRDLGGDVIHPGAFSKTLAERGGKIKLLWQHNPNEPIGKLLEMREDPLGLYVKAVISDTAKGRDALALLRDGAIGAMSIGYDPMAGGTDYTKEANGDTTRNLREIKLWECSLVTFPMNEQAGVTSLKAAWDAAYINDLPDGAFLYVEDGDQDEDGKTTPRSLRHFPYRDADGEIDLPHLRNAIARIPQSNAPGLDDAAKERLQTRARRLLEEAQGEKAVKSGRVISKANHERIMHAIESIQAGLMALSEMLESAGISETPEEEYIEDEAQPDEMDGCAPKPRRKEAGPLPATPTSARDKLLLEIDLLSTL